jgi:hypothetical protein
LFIALLVAIGAFGVQVHTVVLGARAAKAGAAWAAWWGPAFWSGFALGLLAAAFIGRIKDTAPPLRIGGATLVLGAAAAAAAQGVNEGSLFVLLQLTTGAAWAIYTSVAVRAAMTYGASRGIGSPLGLIFSALAVGVLARAGLTVAGWQGAAWLAWVPTMAFLASGGVLWVFAAGGSRTREATVA